MLLICFNFIALPVLLFLSNEVVEPIKLIFTITQIEFHRIMIWSGEGNSSNL